MNPTVSVVMPAFNAVRTLPTSVRSVIDQSFTDWELLIVDDCSKDLSFEVLTALEREDMRVSIIRLEKNVGVAQARNVAIERATGKYIAFLDSDDAWHQDKLHAQVNFMNLTNCAVSYSNYLRITEAGNVLSLVKAPPQLTYIDLLKGNAIGLSTAMYRKDMLPHLRFFPVGHEDYVFWLNALKQIGIAYKVTDAKPLTYYCVRGDSLSRDKLRALKWQWHIYRNVLHLGITSSAYYFFRYAIAALRKRL